MTAPPAAAPAPGPAVQYRRLDATEWAAFFAALAPATGAPLAPPHAAIWTEVRVVVGEALVPLARWCPVRAAEYTAGDDTIAISVTGLTHRIAHPVAIYMAEAAGELTHVFVIERDGSSEALAFCGAPSALC